MEFSIPAYRQAGYNLSIRLFLYYGFKIVNTKHVHFNAGIISFFDLKFQSAFRLLLIDLFVVQADHAKSSFSYGR